MKTFGILTLSAVIAAQTLGAAVLYQPTPIGSSVRTADFGTNQQSGFRTFDNFTIASGGIVEKVTWRGLYIDFANPDPAPAPTEDVLNWELSFHADNAGLPGTQLAFETFAAADVSSTFLGTGFFSVGQTYRVSYYEYSVDLANPFLALSGTQYWFGLLGISDNANPAFALLGATGYDDSSVQQTLGAGMSVVDTVVRARDRAITLEGTVPEPGTYALSVLGLGLLIARKRRTAA